MNDDSPGYVAAVYGAAGALGTELLTALEGEGLPLKELIPVGAVRSAGSELLWRNRPTIVRSAPAVPVEDVDLAILVTPDTDPEATAELRAGLVRRGALVVDVSRSGRRTAELPLVLPGLNEAELERHSGAFAVPCGITNTAAGVIAALAGCGRPITAVDAVALLGASHAGRGGQEALSGQTLALLNYRMPEPGHLGAVLAFNVLMGSGEGSSTDDPAEDDLRHELPRVVPDVAAATIRTSCVRVPVFAGLALVLTVRFEGEGPSLDEAQRALGAWPGISLESEGLALRDTLDVDEVLVAPPRRDPDGSLRVFAAADPLHRTAAAVARLVEHVIREDLW